MLRKFLFFSVALLFVVITTEESFSQEPSPDAEQAATEQSARERFREQREERRRNNPFPNGPPPGTISIMLRAGVNSMQKGGGNTFMLLNLNGPEPRKAMGFTEENEKEFEALRNELRGQMLQKMPQYANRLMKMTPDDQAAIQADIEKDFQAVTDRVDKIATPEMKQNARKLMFQATGGLDSPMMNPDTLETLNLTKEQKEKALATFKEMEPERKAQFDEFLGLLEQQAAVGGPGNLTNEQRAEFEAKMEALGSRMFATGKKLGDALRKHLSDEQRDLATKLMADRPDFLGPLPPQMRGETEKEYRPGADSWKPGQGAPKNDEERTRKPFPLSEMIP